MRGFPWRGLLTAALLFAGLGAVASGAAAQADEPADSKLQLVLDSSGSMKEPTADGSSKIDAAKQALNTVVDRLPDQSLVGLRVYGATVYDKKQPGACQDSQQVVQIGPVDKPALKSEIAKYRPYGETPIAYSLRQAANDLGGQGKRTILLVSDGEETCDADPCAVAKAIHDKGIDLRIDVVGLNVDAGARQQLSCVADRGGGTYYDAKDADDLTASLDQSALRAFRPFQLSGLPVHGATKQQETPELEPGQYTDQLGGTKEEDGRKYYTVRRTPGSTTHVGFTAYPETHYDIAGFNDAVTLKLLTPDGDECASQVEMQNVAGTRTLLAASVTYQPGTESVAAACESGDRLLLEVVRGTDQNITNPAPEAGSVPFEFQVIEEPPLADRDGLPEPLGTDQEPNQDADVPTTPAKGNVEGGGGFSSAPILQPGTWTDSLQPGEVLFYRVAADWGQTPRVSFRLQPNANAQARLGTVGADVKVDAYGPAREHVHNADLHTINSVSAAQTTTLTSALIPVRYRNREAGSTTQQAMSLAGYYYFEITMERVESKIQLPMEISVAVDGEPAGAPHYKQPTPEPEETKQPADGTKQKSNGDAGNQQAAQPSNPNAILPVAAVGGGGVLVLAGLILAIVFLRNRKPNVPPHDQSPSNPGPPYYGRRP